MQASSICYSYYTAARIRVEYRLCALPTRFRPGETPSLLDLVFTNEQDMINNICDPV